MRPQKILVAGLPLVFMLSLSALFAQATPDKQKETKPQETKQPEKIRIPKEIKAIMQEGLATRQGRQDIPFTITRIYQVPIQAGSEIIAFIFQAKNADLGFAAPAPPPQPKTKGQQPPTATPAPGVLQANLSIYYEFLQTDASEKSTAFREGYIPFSFQEESASYDPNKEDWYSFSYILPPTKYTLAMAIATPDLKKVGVGYYDFALPGPEAYEKTIDITPVFFVKKIDQLQSPELYPTVHRESFACYLLQITPDANSIVTPENKGQIEPFYYVLGAKTKGQPPDTVCQIQTTYEVQKPDGTIAIRWEMREYVHPLVDQPLPLKQTLQITDEKGRRTEQRDLPAGKYNLVIKITDMLSGGKVEKTVPFEVK